MGAYKKVNENFLVSGMILDNTTGQTYDLSGSIESVAVKEDYLENSFPLFMINFSTTKEYRDILMKNDVELSLKVDIYETNNGDENGSDTEDIYPSETLFEVILRIYERPFISTSTKTDDIDNENTENLNQDQTVPMILYQVSGIPKKLIQKNKKVINKVFQDASMNEILINILSAIDDNITIERSTNLRRERSVLIPPLSPVPALKFLQNNYGIYSSPLLLYFGLEKSYCGTITQDNADIENNFNIIVRSSNTTENSLLYSNVQKEEGTENLQLFYQAAPQYSRDELIGDELGVENIVYSYDDNFNLITNQTTMTSPNSEKVRYFWNSTGDTIHEEQFRSLMKNREALLVNTKFVRPTLFTPLTRVIVSGEEEKVNGEYFIATKTFMFSSQDSRHFICENSLKLIKK